MKEIQLTQDRVALVDDADFEYLNQFKWCVDKGRNTLYAQRRLPTVNGERCKIRMHHAILGKPLTNFETDHCDGNDLNNQRHNLRFVTRRQNQQNKKNKIKPKTSQYPGVYWHKTAKKWCAQIYVNKTRKHLGLFINEVEAFEIYRKAINGIGATIIDYD